jgi:hypothetical protein
MTQSQPALLGSLADFRRRARMLTGLFGAGVTVASAIALVLFVVLLDYLFNLPVLPRLVFLLGAIGAMGYVAWRYIVRPLTSKASLGDVASYLERVFPDFDDHLRSTVDFVTHEVPGSETMKRRVVAEADRRAAGVDMGQALATRPVLMANIIGGAALLLFLALLWLAGPLAGIAGNRLVGGDAKWPRAQKIEMINPLPAKVAAGQRVDLRMKVEGYKKGMRATVYVKYDNGSVQKQLMNENGDGTYNVAVDARGEKMSVWIGAGDDKTDPQTVAVVPPLAIQKVEAIVTPPAYAKLSASTVNLSEAPGTVVYGSTVQLKVTFNKPLLTGLPVNFEPVKAEAKPPAIQWTGEANRGDVALGTFVATESLRFHLKAQDTDHFQNAGLEEYELVVRPDQNPTVIIENPRRNEDRTANSFVKLEALAEDDFDISTMTLVVDRLGEKKMHAEIPLAGWQKTDAAGSDRKRFRAAYTWELKDLKDAEGKSFDLKPGDVLEYLVRVTDNYEYNGAKHEPAVSGKLKIQIISQEQLNQQIINALQTVGEEIKRTKGRQDTTKEETKNLQEGSKEKPEIDTGDRTALNRINDQQSTIASQTKQLAGKVGEIEKRLEENRAENQELKNISADVKNNLNNTAEQPMSQAAQKLTEAANKADPKASKTPDGKTDPQKQQQNQQGRNDAMAQAQQKQQQASDQLGKALEKMNNLGTFEQMIQRVREALAEQQKLSEQLKEAGKETIGKKPEELTPEQKKKLDQIAAEQKKAAEKTEKLTQELNKAADQNQKSDPASSQAMKQAAQQSQQQQVSQNQQQASQQAQQNQQAQAQAKQKQAELGLQMMLDTLREAERRKLAQLAAELAKLQEQLATLIKRQAGHNVDNLRIQNIEAALKLVTDELLAKAERVKDKQPPAPDVPGLTNSQTITERNTRDVSKMAEDLQKGGAEIAAMIIKAAGLMERAIVTLKDKKLPEAFDPSQVKALAALEEAKQKTDEALKEVQDQQADANRETIRQAYERIRDAQKKINGTTAELDGKKKDGKLGAIDTKLAIQLTGPQGKLADDTKNLEKDLSSLGGIVYVWANKDIVDSMNEVKKDLSKPETGKPTQAEERRIVEQLDAMIKSLTTKPKPPIFNAGGGGGGGGAPKPKLPTEAELRLLKELQLAVNKSTEEIDKLPNRDKPKLVGLGNRQGELRNLLDQLLRKASDGEAKLAPEPDPKDRLPEEAKVDDIEEQELNDWLNNKKSGDDQMTDDVKLVGQRMARSRQRLALDHDPGKTTQAIQKRILMNLDNLIELSRQQLVQSQSKPQKGQGQPQQGQPKPGDGQQGQQGTGRQPGTQSQPNRGSSPAQNEKGGGSQNNTADLSKELREKASEWGKLTDRERQAIIEGAGDRPLDKYNELTRRYYESIGKKATEQR